MCVAAAGVAAWSRLDARQHGGSWGNMRVNSRITTARSPPARTSPLRSSRWVGGSSSPALFQEPVAGFDSSNTGSCRYSAASCAPCYESGTVPASLPRSAAYPQVTRPPSHGQMDQDASTPARQHASTRHMSQPQQFDAAEDHQKLAAKLCVRAQHALDDALKICAEAAALRRPRRVALGRIRIFRP